MAINLANYLAQVQSPVEAAMQGYQGALDARQRDELIGNQQQRQGVVDDRAAQNFANQQTIFQQGQQDRAAGQQAAQAQQQRLAEYHEFMRTNGGTLAGVKEALRLFPEMTGKMQDAYKMLSDEHKAATSLFAGRALAAIQNGREDMAISMISDYADAMRGTDANAAAMLDQMVKMPVGILKDQLAAFAVANGLNVPDHLIDDAGTAAAVTDIGKIEQDYRGGLISKEMRDKLLEGGGADALDTKDRFNAEKDLRAEYNKRVGDWTKAVDHYDRLKASGADDTGAGDVALIFSFMKMLDPGSVVRESEFAIAQDTAGLVQRLQNQYQKAQEGTRLSPEQRQSFINLAAQFMDAAVEKEGRIRTEMQAPISNYGLNPENVFGAGRGPSSDFSQMGRNQLARVDVMSLTEEELDAYEARWVAIRGE